MLVWADNAWSPEEEMGLDALLPRARSLITLGPGDVPSYIKQFENMLEGSNHIYPLAECAIRNLSVDQSLAVAVFAHCADIVYADRRVNEDEREFLIFLNENLQIKPSDFRRILKVLAWKHAF